MPLFISMIFIIGFGVLFTSVFCIQKTENKENGLSWIILSIVICMAFNAFWVGVTNLLHIPVHILVTGISDMIFGSMIWIWIYKTKKIQKYQWKKEDFVFLVVYSIIVGRFCFIQFPGLNPNFQAIDAPRHLQYAEKIIFDKNITSGMFYADLYGSIVIELLSPIFDVDNYYKAFVISEIVNLFLSGLTLYAVYTDKIKNRANYIIAYILTVLYVFGYPVSNLQYGFVYWGMSITILTCIIFMFTYLNKGGVNYIYIYIVLLFLNFAIFECYSMFVPPVFLSEGLYYLYLKKKRVFSRQNICNFVIMFIPAILIGMIYSAGLLYNLNTTVENGNGGTATYGIALEGNIYKDLYRDFMLFIFFVIIAIIDRIKNRKITFEIFSFGCSLAYMMLMLTAGLSGKVSSYYYCKNNYMMWLLIFVLAYQGLKFAWDKYKETVISYGIILAVLFSLFFGSFEIKIQSRNNNYDFGNVNDILKIYSSNKEMVDNSKYNSSYIEIYKEIYNNYVKKGYKVAISSDFWLHETWFNVVTNQKFAICESNFDVYVEQCESKADYVFVLYDSFYQNNIEHYNNYEKVEDYGIGFLIKI